MIIEAPIVTRAGFSPADPGPETNKHYAISEAALARFNQKSIAEQLYAQNLQDAETYRSYHLGLPGSPDAADRAAEERFINRNADQQVTDAKMRLKENLAAIEEASLNAPEAYQFFTGGPIAEHPEAWAFDAPAGFGDLSTVEQTRIALAARPEGVA